MIVLVIGLVHCVRRFVFFRSDGEECIPSNGIGIEIRFVLLMLYGQVFLALPFHSRMEVKMGCVS